MDATNINVLCLHGTCQSADAFSGHMKEFLKFARQAKLRPHYITAPFIHPDRGHQWVARKAGDHDYLPSFDNVGEYIYSLDMIITYIKDHNISVLLGFSEGACMIDTLMRTMHDCLTQIKSVILCSGMSFSNSPLFVPRHIRVLNVISTADNIVPFECKPVYEEEVFELILSHDKGHNMPRNHEMRIMINFALGNNECVPFKK